MQHRNPFPNIEKEYFILSTTGQKNNAGLPGVYNKSYLFYNGAAWARLPARSACRKTYGFPPVYRY
jgi:hypothetical protein